MFDLIFPIPASGAGVIGLRPLALVAAELAGLAYHARVPELGVAIGVSAAPACAALAGVMMQFGRCRG